MTEAGHVLLQVALDHGIEIPHYCYHPKLSIDGSCRMCQVKIERAPKLAIACNTPVADGMVVDTQSAEVAEARRGVMELMLLNHPLDCPICDQAGECYLQDYSFGYGRQHARTTSPRRKGLKRHPIGPRVVFDEERCILCRRCVRFTEEISKTGELRVFGIGDRSHIGTVPDRPLDNAYSVCTADICPVGALLSADFHHKRRVWFLEEVESVCPSCANGCNIKLGMFRNEIQRLVPRRNDAVNDTWMCDHGRLHYHFVQDETRVRVPRVDGVDQRLPSGHRYGGGRGGRSTHPGGSRRAWRRSGGADRLGPPHQRGVLPAGRTARRHRHAAPRPRGASGRCRRPSDQGGEGGQRPRRARCRRAARRGWQARGRDPRGLCRAANQAALRCRQRRSPGGARRGVGAACGREGRDV